MHDKLDTIDSNFKREDVQNAWMSYYESQNQKGNKLNTEDVFFLLRYVHKLKS